MLPISIITDEISPELKEQLAVLESENIREIELRSFGNKNLLDLADDEISNIKKEIDLRGFSVIAISSPIGKVKITDDFEQHFKRFERALELAQYFQAHIVRIFGYYLPEDSHNSYNDEIIRRMRMKTEKAKDKNVVLVLENEDQSLFGSISEEVIKLIKAVNSKHFRFLYDPGNYLHFFQKKPYPEFYDSTNNFIHHIHVKDARLGEKGFLVPGTGEVDYPQLLKRLKKDGYNGYLSLEPHLASAGVTGGFAGVEGARSAIQALKKLILEI